MVIRADFQQDIMILKELQLRNIRSYLNELVVFPQGTSLLCGDIGSGKSTILLAIEFALFGLLRGEVSGETLLRKGSNSGEVQLTFEVGGEEIIVKRSLKRTKTSVSQDAGFIVRNGQLNRATPVELKARILALLGYPQEYLGKGRNLLYRFTVYTPQEQMKAILQEDSSMRLEVLRKLFDIDKYQRIQDNAATYLRILREQFCVSQTEVTNT